MVLTGWRRFIQIGFEIMRVWTHVNCLSLHSHVFVLRLSRDWCSVSRRHAVALIAQLSQVFCVTPFTRLQDTDRHLNPRVITTIYRLITLDIFMHSSTCAYLTKSHFMQCLSAELIYCFRAFRIAVILKIPLFEQNNPCLFIVSQSCNERTLIYEENTNRIKWLLN